MFGEISRCFMRALLGLLALLACPVAALAEPVYSMSILPTGGDARGTDGADRVVGQPSQGVSLRDGAPPIGFKLDVDSGGVAIDRLGPALDEGQAGRANALKVEAADGWTLVEAGDTDDSRHILGKACRGGECLPVPLDPVSAVPEPGSYALLAAGLVLLAGWRKSDRRESLRFF